MQKHHITTSIEQLFVACAVATKKLSEVQADILREVRGKDLSDAWEFVGKHIVPTVAKKYGAVAEQTRNGTWTLKRKDGTRHDTAYSFLRSLLATTNLLAGSGDTNKNSKRKNGDRNKTEKQLMTQRDFVLKAFKLLSVADRKWVIKQAGI